MLSAEQMRSLPDFFTDIADPRRAQGRRHSLPTVLAIAAGAILCGMRGYKAIADWAKASAPRPASAFVAVAINGRYLVPSESIIRDVLIRVDPARSGPRSATLESSLWPRRHQPGHRRQDHVQRP